MTLNTSLKKGLFAVLTVSLIAYMFLQQDTIRMQADNLLRLEDNLTFFKTSLAAANEENDFLHSQLSKAELAVEIMGDSVVFLNEQMNAYANDARKRKKEIRGIKKELGQQKEEVNMLKGAISDWSSKGVQMDEKIQAMELQLVMKNENITQLSDMLQKTELELEQANDNQLVFELKRQRLERIAEVVQHTKVEYKQVLCQKTKSGKALSKIKEDGTDWVYTSFSFSIENPDQSLIVDEQFRLKIVDSETGKALAYNEANPIYASKGAETIGYGFQWISNPTELTYINMQAKTGRNYNVQIYYINDGQEHLISSSVQPFIRNGKMVK